MLGRCSCLSGLNEGGDDPSGRRTLASGGTLSRPELLKTRLNQIPGRVQEWKKSSARCGADVALSLVQVHFKEAKEDKLAALKVANTKKHSFQSFTETFLEAATRIADSIDLDSFCDPASPSPAE